MAKKNQSSPHPNPLPPQRISDPEYRARGNSRRAFTLVEVMLSLVFALILLIGMNAVFRDASDAVQAGQKLSEITRNSRTVQPILYGDMKDCAPDSPAFVISSSVVPQYLNAADSKATQAYALTQSPQLANGGLPQSGCLLGDHLHRTDMLMFFARGQFRRRTENTPLTGAPGTAQLQSYQISSTTSDEAYIHYGHLRMLGTDGVSYIGPDDYAGAAEPYAADWVLGRNVVLMMPYSPANARLLYAGPADPQAHAEIYYSHLNGTATANEIAAPWSTLPTAVAKAAANIAPLGYNSFDSLSTATVAKPGTQVESSRYDLADVSIDQYRSILSSSATAQSFESQNATPYVFWWTPLVYAQPFLKVLAGSNPVFPVTHNTTTIGAPFSSPPYYTGNNGGINFTNAAAFATGFPGLPFPKYRFQGATVLSTNPLTAADQANLSPIFLEHVSQFIVEYAGDFTTQDPNSGIVTDTVPDGQIDWMYVTKGDYMNDTAYQTGDYVISNGVYYQAGSPPPPMATAPPGGTWTSGQTIGSGWSRALVLSGANANPPPKAIRWYGMPRDSTGSGHVPTWWGVKSGNKVNSTSQPLVSAGNTNELNNVVPLSDVWLTSQNNNARAIPYEVETGLTLVDPSITVSPQNVVTDYASSTLNAGIPTGMIMAARYTAVWRNDVPAMIRIIYKVDDSNNDLKDGPTYECVFKLK